MVVELLSSEANYTESLRKMISYYKEPLTGVLSELEISSIFSIADLLADFHATLLQGLQQCLESWTPQILVGCFLVEKLSFLRCYSAYINNYHLAINTLAACEQHAPFRSRMQELCAAETEDGRHLQSLYSYLIIPIQRIPRYLLLLKDLQRHTAPDHSDTPHLEKAVTAIGEIAAYIENKRSLYEGCQRMAAIAGSIRRLPEGQTVLKPGRTLVREGVLFCKEEDSQVHCFLFSDALLITLARQKFEKNRSPSRALSTSRRTSLSVTPAPGPKETFRFVDMVPLNDPASVTVANYAEELFAITALSEGPRTHHLQPLISDSNGLDSNDARWVESICSVLRIPVPSPVSVPLFNAEFLPQSGSGITRLLNFGTRRSTRPRSGSRLSEVAGLAAVADLCQESSSRSELKKRAGFASVSAPVLPGTESRSSVPSHQSLVLARYIPPNSIPIPHHLPQWDDLRCSEDIMTSKMTPRSSTSSSSSVGAEEQPLILRPISGYQLEAGFLESRPELYLPPVFMFPEMEVAFYPLEMANLKHINLFASLPDGSKPAVVSIEDVKKLPFRRVLIRTAAGKLRDMIPLTVGPFGVDFGPFRSYLVQHFPSIFSSAHRWSDHEPSQMPTGPMDSPQSLRERLCSYDNAQRSLYARYKIGVVSTKPGDMLTGTDRAIFTTREASADFEEFLAFLGDRLPLHDSQGLTGGLDIENDLTGAETLRTTFKSMNLQYEVLFHVSTMLPFNEEDKQQPARKWHIGNDIVVVVFHQDDQPFDPRVFRSKFNQVFLVVKKVGVAPENGCPLYQLGLTCKEATPPCFPLLPQNNVFAAGPNFHRFLISKIINAEAVTMRYSPTFSARLARTRRHLLSEIIASYANIRGESP